MKNRISTYIILGIIALAVFGLSSSLFSDPAGFLKRIAVIFIVGGVIFFVIRSLTRARPNGNEHRAFAKAAKKSKRRFQHNASNKGKSSKASGNSVTMLKRQRKKSTAHLTVIDGKKGKKKDRATL